MSLTGYTPDYEKLVNDMMIWNISLVVVVFEKGIHSDKQDLGRGFILLLPQAAVLAGSDANSDSTKSVSSFVIQSHQISCSCVARCMEDLGMTWSSICSGGRPRSSVKKLDPIRHWTNGIVQQQFAGD